MKENFLSTSESKSLELPAGVYTLLSVHHKPGRLADYAKMAGSWLLLDQSSPAYLLPLEWGLRIESEKTHEVALNFGIQLVHSDARYNDVLHIVEESSGTQIRCTPQDFVVGAFRG